MAALLSPGQDDQKGARHWTIQVAAPIARAANAPIIDMTDIAARAYLSRDYRKNECWQ